VFRLDEEADQLVFEAVSGEGEQTLVGRRRSSSTGIAGWVMGTRQPLVMDDVSSDPRFASQAAESTGYVPKAIMAVPLLSGERSLGVLEVLDRPSGERFTVEQADLLGMFATQAAIALDLLAVTRSTRTARRRRGRRRGADAARGRAQSRRTGGQEGRYRPPRCGGARRFPVDMTRARCRGS
jgi:GAF domain-containing protein